MAFYRGEKKCNRLSAGLMMIWEGFWKSVCEEMCVHSFNGQGKTDFSHLGAAAWGVWHLRIWIWSFGKANEE